MSDVQPAPASELVQNTTIRKFRIVQQNAVLTTKPRAEEAVVNRKLTTAPALKQVDGVVNVDNNYATTHPLQGHLVGCCLGRKNRLRAVFSFLA